jgi:hypothetical protein
VKVVPGFAYQRVGWPDPANTICALLRRLDAADQAHLLGPLTIVAFTGPSTAGDRVGASVPSYPATPNHIQIGDWRLWKR